MTVSAWRAPPLIEFALGPTQNKARASKAFYFF